MSAPDGGGTPGAPRSEDERRALHGEEYVARFERSPIAARLARVLDRVRLGGSDDVVDLGCGGGHLLEILAPRVRSCVGVDFSEPFVEAARRRLAARGLDNARVERASIEDFCASHPESFDVAFALDLAEHVPDDEWLRILHGVRGALVPGGRLYLHTPNASFFVELLKSRNLVLRQPEQHVAVRTVRENVRLVEEAGFGTVEAVILPHYNVLRWLHPLSRLPLVGRLFEARILIAATR